MALIKTNARSSSQLDATILTGNLPAINGSALTNLTAGKILQVTNGDYSTQFNNATDSAADIGVSAAITPSATSSKILIIADTQWKTSIASGKVLLGGIGLYADIGGAGYNRISGGDGGLSHNYSLGYIDNGANAERQGNGRWTVSMVWSPSTTSACTFKLYSQNNSGNSISCTYASATTHINLMEIGA
jgi:hypothetical protein